MNDDDLLKENLIEIQSNARIEMEFEKLQLEQFWCKQLELYPQLAKAALETLLPFSTTYLCEIGFSSLLNIKTKARNRLNASADLRVALSKKVPRFTRIIMNKQQQCRH